MAAENPYAPPESLMLQQFNGLRNNIAPERLEPGDLDIARNVYLDDVGQLRSRQGFVRVSTSECHSFKEIAGRYFGVVDGVLGTFALDRTFTPIATVGDDLLDYIAVGGTVYASSTSWSGKISALNVVSTWGVADDTGQWVSPVLTPTDTLGEIAGRQLRAPPLSGIIESYRGRAYLAVGSVLWVTELFLYDKIDPTRGYVQFEHDITMVVAVEDGLYVGTTQGLHFLQGAFVEGLKYNTILDTPVIAGSVAMVPTTKVHPSARQQPMPEGEVPMFTTQAGVCVGLPGGTVYNLTYTKVVLPALTDGAALYRDDPGASLYVYADQQGTAWAVNTHTGAVTEYENYTFTTFMRLGDEYLGGAADGLYTLDGDDDAGDETPLRVRSGFLRFGGARLARLKGAYITARTGDNLTMTLESSIGQTYVYDVTTREMRTMRIHMGKGQRATMFRVQLDGSALDLDLLELVPQVMQRRV